VLKTYPELLMIRSFYEVYQQANPDKAHYYCKFGYAIALLSQSPQGMNRSISYVQTILTPAIMTRQICFLFNEAGDPVAYLIWAYLAPDVERRVLTSFRFDLHVSEWNEGTSLWVVDLVAPQGHLKHVLRFARDKLFQDESKVRYLRENQRFRRAIEHTREKLLGCLRSMPPASIHCRCGDPNCQYFHGS
jgi:hemolysin-activating ACP:hemolysin acyltransferase